MAEGLLRHRLSDLGIGARVRSAGLLFDDRPASDEAIAVLGDRGIDIGGHRSRRIAADLIEETDLVLGLAREHVREVALVAPDALPRTFTLKELVRRGETIGGRLTGQQLPDWLARVALGRKRADILGSSDSDDVTDPIGRPRSFYETTLADLSNLVDRLVALLFVPDAGIGMPARESA